MRALDPNFPQHHDQSVAQTLQGVGWERRNIRQALLPKMIDPGTKIVDRGMKRPVAGVPYVSPYAVNTT